MMPAMTSTEAQPSESATERCPSCLMTGFESLTAPCAFCGILGCDLCICREAAELSLAWWELSTEQRATWWRGLSVVEMTRDDAIRYLDAIRKTSGQAAS